MKNERAKKERLYAACKDAAKFFHECLLSDEGKSAREYLLNRGLDPKTIKRFGLGYAPDAWDSLLSFLKEKGYSNSEMLDAGLIVKGKKENSFYDAYRGRVIFPIIAANSRVIAFGARTMGKDEPKYLNTGDTLIFNKRNNLYAMNMQKGKQNHDLVIVEGYMDVISLHKSGVDNAVASLGTALTQQQARLIKRYVKRVYICYDGDAAGQNAMLRGLDILAKEELEVRVMVIPGGMDPDEFVKKNGKDSFNSLKDKALSLNAYKLLCIERGCDLTTDEGREDYAKKACAFVSTIEPVERERCVAQIARKSGLSRQTVFEQCGMSRPAKEQQSVIRRGNQRFKKEDETVEMRKKAEQMLIACIGVSKESAMYVMEKMAEEKIEFSIFPFEEYASAILVEYAQHDNVDDAMLLSSMSKESAEELLPALELSDTIGESVTAVADDCIKTIKADAIRAQIREIMNGADPKMSDFTDKMREAEALKRKLAML